jgi:hypothetical protein
MFCTQHICVFNKCLRPIKEQNCKECTWKNVCDTNWTTKQLLYKWFMLGEYHNVHKCAHITHYATHIPCMKKGTLLYLKFSTVTQFIKATDTTYYTNKLDEILNKGHWCHCKTDITERYKYCWVTRYEDNGVGIINNKVTPWTRYPAKKPSHSASQEITPISWKLKVCYCVHKSPSMNPILSSLMLNDLVIRTTLNISK